MTSNEIEEITTKVYVKILNFLSYKMRSEKDVSDRIDEYLAKEHLPKEARSSAHDKIISRLTSEFYVNDAKYVDMYVDEIVRNKSKSIIEAKRFLFGKGIDENLIEEAFSKVSLDYELELATGLAQKKFRTLSKDSPAKKKQKLTMFLARKGFSYDIIYSAVDSVLNLQ